ncbi:uncharacterized protein PITG_03565 [Phytophthora infestans T30-4]|uniref:Uncharacterized protein n=1 Tax=Phytophthora infestans (strain T30-4) TaxID=403677 RepID=D0MXX9_PHYIT|nr:uncharacterized protein PITG_03565 [Phytophthora infestans T30-4]EEY66027.1 hypothetical protein PITG_03565 [Phytophthora infestans T30-4]|eukprot:XP_002906626.1 hypothetical protein PITG_03565 [Phytophthora infestans T30-4]
MAEDEAAPDRGIGLVRNHLAPRMAPPRTPYLTSKTRCLVFLR